MIFLNRFFYPDHSATSQMVSDLAFHLARRGWEVAAITSRLRYEDAEPAYPERERVSGVEIYRVRTSRFGRFSLPGRAIDYLTFYLSSGRCLRRLVQPGDVVVAKTDPPLISIVAERIAIPRGARLVNWIQDLFPEIAVALGVRRLGGRVGRWLQERRNRSLARAEVNVVIGENMAERLLAEGVARDRIRVIHNWVDGESIQPVDHENNPLREEWDLGERFVVGYSGNLGRVHEYATILGAAERLRGREDILFLFIGGGALSQELQRECAERALKNVRFLPYQASENLGRSLSACDAHLIVLRPEIEGLVVPSKFYGVIAAGRPVLFIGDEDGGIARMIDEAGAGMSIGIGDVKALTNAVVTLMADAQARDLLGRNARAAFDSRYSRAAALEQWEAVLDFSG